MGVFPISRCELFNDFQKVDSSSLGYRALGVKVGSVGAISNSLTRIQQKRKMNFLGEKVAIKSLWREPLSECNGLRLSRHMFGCGVR